MSDFQGLYEVRDGTDKDANFILATFLRGIYYGDSWFSLIPKPVFMDNYKRIAQAILKNPRTIVKIACLKEDPDVILGYSIMSSDFAIVHYLYVKSAWRKKGIGKSLIPKYPIAFTHLTALGKSLATKYPTAIFNPFAI